jgi:MoxR-like ATPase
MGGHEAVEELTRRIEQYHTLINQIRSEIGKVLIGQRNLIEGLLIGLFTKGHILIEGVPGLAKTSAVKALADTVQADFKRIQFTPDLLPADLLGTEVYRPKTGDFVIKKGPLFNHIILADEINQITIGEATFGLEDPFLVLATQNPIEQEGTYPLPEAQVDRFMLKLLIGYPDKAEEKQIMQRVGFEKAATIQAVLSPDQLNAVYEIIHQIYMDDKLRDYIVDLVFATREPQTYKLDVAPYIQYGASPRATIFLSTAARAYAFLHGRAYVTPQDVKTIAPPVLRHRIIPTYEAEAEDITTDQIIQRIFDAVPVP